MDASEIQQGLFQVIKASIPPNLSATEEIAKVLDVSVDSVYRRMRGEKSISLDELYKLCSYYKISLDQLMNLQTGAFMFRGNFLNNKTFRFEEWLKGIVRDLSYMNGFKDKHFYYLCKDVPVFNHFYFREIAAFKYFFWMKTIFQFPEFQHRRFQFAEYSDELNNLGEKVLDLYNQLPSTELWNVENINIAIRQIEFYRDSQMFESDKDVLKLYETWEKVIDHVEKQASAGYKFKHDDPDMKPIGSYNVYFNEVILGDNSFIVLLEGTKMALMCHTVINYMQTRDVNFCENMYEYVQNLMKRSTLISKVSEKERSKFFRILRERIGRRKETLKV
ncbi:MAG TPA: helix-turn-helix transcriptional regulator [Chitinophagaceae bacterium]|jgi:transcriptional regulator with XRE-family HTH domain|nr:helix-turn-helix transcriptional regulator [Chitinophagaceae bacterium]